MNINFNLGTQVTIFSQTGQRQLTEKGRFQTENYTTYGTQHPRAEEQLVQRTDLRTWYREDKESPYDYNVERQREEDSQREATVLESAIIRVTTRKDLGKSHRGPMPVFSPCDRNSPHPRSFKFLTVSLISTVPLELGIWFCFSVKVEKTLNFAFLLYAVQRYQ